MSQVENARRVQDYIDQRLARAVTDFVVGTKIWMPSLTYIEEGVGIDRCRKEDGAWIQTQT